MLKRRFHKGIMNLDADERLLPDGEHREALNINVANSEGSDVGAIETSLSNKRLTNIDLGPNPKTISWLEDEPEDKIYWHVKSDTGCFLIEWDDINQLVSIVLKDTRPQGERVLDLHEDYLITGMVKVVSEDTNEDLLIWTDNNMEPCCINIERAKTWGENNFDIEDILLIKKPPRYAPIVTPTYVNDLSNNIEDKFLSVSYRYKYRDGEYSALSDYANYSFYPRVFDLDHYTLENKGMISSYNGMLIKFNTGDKRVTDIQIVVKYSNSNSLYIVETFNKKELSWLDNEIKQSIFSNEEIYMQMDSNQLRRAFDNVPLKAKALTLIGNIPVFGNYLEGRDIVDENGDTIPTDYTLSLNTEPIVVGIDFGKSISNNIFKITNPEGIELSEGNRFTIYFDVELAGNSTYSSDFFFVLDKDYDTLDEMFTSDAFTTLLEVINSDFKNNYNSEGTYSVPDGWVVLGDPVILYQLTSGVPSFVFGPVTYTDTYNDNTEHSVVMKPTQSCYSTISESTNSTSIKTNRSLSVGLVYQDGYNRRTTVLTSPSSSIFIPQSYSKYKNSLRATINSKPPHWADRYKLVVKAQPLHYQTIYINTFFNDNSYVWCKLEAENKDKVKVGDILIVKAAAGEIILEPVEVKVLELASKSKDFIEGNTDEEGLDIIELPGYYMKIRAEGFSMDFDDYKILQSEGPKKRSSGHPTTYMPLFTEINNGGTVLDHSDDTVTGELSIPAGSSIRIKLDSWREYDDHQARAIYDKTHYAQRDYETLEEWMNENFIGKYMKGVKQHEEGNVNYSPNVSMKRGYVKKIFGNYIFIEDNNPDKYGLFLVVKGLYSGGSKNRKGNVMTKIEIRTSTGLYVFETKEKQAENNIYYETEQCFDIVDGNHTGNVQSQDVNNFTPAIVDLDFFNCYTQGNGVESYRVKDGFNTNFLNIDLRPSTTSVEKYRAVRRFADLTFGGAFIESSNINKLNEFNLSLGNWKELDKQYGSIQRIESRESDLVVFQEDKASKVLFGKDVIKSAEGVNVITSTPEILGQQIPIPGENGIGLNPESFAKDMFRFYWVNPRRGTPIRLSMDGATEINYGMISFFRDLFILNPTSKKLGGFDPYHRQYFLSVEDEKVKRYIANCGNTIYKTITEPFTYFFRLNELSGNFSFNYNITQGVCDIEVDFDNTLNFYNSLVGSGTIEIPRTSIQEDVVKVTITPANSATIEITNNCPVGDNIRVGTIILSDPEEAGKTMKNKYRWGSKPFYEETHVFGEGPISKFDIAEGLEGSTRFPINGSQINIQAFKDSTSTGTFTKERCNRLGYLVSPAIYTEADIETILQNANWLTLSETQVSLNTFVSQSNFTFNKNENKDILYLIWDYIDRKPIAHDMTEGVQKGQSVLINPIPDTNNEEYSIVIVSEPLNGTVSILPGNQISYTHDNSEETLDSFTYKIITKTCNSKEATVNLIVSIPCDASFSYQGARGVFSYDINFGTAVGDCGISYDAFGIPDKFEIEWNGQLVATTTDMVSGQGSLTFNKNLPEPITATITVTATNQDTEWTISGICPVKK